MLKIKIINRQTSDFIERELYPENQLNQEFFIGRHPSCGLVLQSPEVSRIHARIVYSDDRYYFTDLGSAGGSIVSNQDAEINRRYPLKAGSIIEIEPFLLLVQAVEKPASVSETSIRDRAVRCVRIIDETPDVKTFRFQSDPPEVFAYKPGQFVTLYLDIDGKPIKRSYSISSTPSRPHALEITVKRVPAPTPDAPPGLVSNWLHDRLTVGSVVNLKMPLGKFTCANNWDEKLLLISAGSGITPMMSMSRWICDTEQPRDIVFLHSARTPQDIIYRDELQWMDARYENFHLAITTTRSQLGQSWPGFTGRINEAMLQLIAADFRDRTVYVCGPNPFMSGVKTLLKSLDFPMQNYYEESFGAPPKAKPTPPAQQSASTESEKTPGILRWFVGNKPTANVPTHSEEKPENIKAEPAIKVSEATTGTLYCSQSKKEIAWNGEKTILEIVEEAGVEIESSCRSGVCGSCKLRKLEGEVSFEADADILDDSDRTAGYILACVAKPVGRVAIEV